MSLHRTITLSALALLLTAGAAHASILVQEQFVYPPGQILPTMSGGTGWAAGTWTGSNQMHSNPPTLQHPVGPTSAGNSLLNDAVGEAFRPFVGGLTNFGADLWISFQEQSGAASSAAIVSLTPPDSTFPDITVFKAAGGAIFLNSSFGGTVLAGSSSGVGNTDLFVIHCWQLSGVNSRIDLFVNPTVAGAFTTPSATFTLITPLALDLEQIYYRSDAMEQLDEIHIGTAPTDVSAVPAPGTLALAGAGALLLLRRRRAR